MDGGSLGRHDGLGSSSSWLDGVPFKIGPKFRPPPKIIYQPVIRNSFSSNSTKEEYNFETEDAVLAWAKARDEALKKASQQQAERASKAAAGAKNNVKGDKLGEKNGKEENAQAGDATATNSDTGNQNEAAKQSLARQPCVPPKPVIPKAISEPGGAILKPTLIQHSNQVRNHNGTDIAANSTTTSAFDIRMFEQVDDPFDNLELQTIDDMEELKTLLDSNPVDNNEQKSPENTNTNLSTLENAENSESFYELAAPISTSHWETFDSQSQDELGQKKLHTDNVSQLSTRTSESPSSDIGEYVEISEETCLNLQNMNGVQQVPPPTMTKSSNQPSVNDALTGNMPKLESARGIYKPVLPPISHNKMEVSNGGDVSHSTEQNNSAPSNNAVSVNLNTNSVSFSTQQFSSPNSNPDKPIPVRIPPPPPTKPTKPNRPAHPPKLRNSGQMWSSTGPSLADSLETNQKPADDPVTNLYSRHSLNQSNPDLSEEVSESAQKSISQLNRYRPLPPTPTPTQSPRPNSEVKSQPLGLTDPYNSLSREAQVFTNGITSMGFLRAKVARAVEKFGQDEKEVLDHLFAVDMLVEKKYAPVHVESALQSCKNDSVKAERLLEMQTQLEQLGFSSDSVRDALITSNMDHDKALDLLTA